MRPDLCVTHHACDCITDERARYADALHRIATMARTPRPDGTFNYSRAAIIDIAARALASTTDQETT